MRDHVNMVLASPRHFDRSTILTSGPTAADLPASNLQKIRNGAKVRFTDLGQVHLEGELAERHLINCAAFLWTNATVHSRNLLKQTETLTHADWTSINLTPTVDASILDAERGPNAWKLTEANTAANVFYIGQPWTKPVTAGGRAVLSAKVKAGDRSHVMLQLSDLQGVPTNRLQVFFDLTTKSVYAIQANGTFSPISILSPQVVPEAEEGWYRIAAGVEFDAGAQLWGQLFLLDSATTDPVHDGTGTEHLWVQHLQLELGEETTRYGANVDKLPAVWRFRLAETQGDLTADPSYDSGLQHFGAGDPSLHLQRFRDIGRNVPSWLWFPQPIAWGLFYRANIYDPDNEDGYFDASRFLVDAAWQPSFNMLHGARIPTPIEAKDRIITARKRGIPIPNRPGLRTSFSLRLKDLDEVYDQIWMLLLERGSSRDVVYVFDPTRRQAQGLVHGFMEPQEIGAPGRRLWQIDVPIEEI